MYATIQRYAIAILLVLMVLTFALSGLLNVNNQRHNCMEIESLKKLQRDAAIEEYNNLDRNGRLLGIKITPELRATTKAELDNTLERFHAESCSGFFGRG